MFKLLRKLRKDERAVTAIEYGLIVALIGVAALVAMSAVGTSLNAMFSTIASDLTNAIGS
ncbi:MAG: Flp family type IVb pilin [Proteobacteria bacterium]|nr:Flp family type IVb pilin [Pseudomonadota bacterium]MCH8171867.1 Flp family type IVb pilin [Pseudomonadota bacterium]MCH8323095.1 Flp family type IVb pilin [Pseudomonadota bacterium]